MHSLILRLYVPLYNRQGDGYLSAVPSPPAGQYGHVFHHHYLLLGSFFNAFFPHTHTHRALGDNIQSLSAHIDHIPVAVTYLQMYNKYI